MSKVRLLFCESWASIRQNLSTTVAATMTVLIGMCLLGLFIALGTWVLSWSGHLQKELQVKVYFCTTESMPDCSTNPTRQQERRSAPLSGSDRDVKSVVFVSKAAGPETGEERQSGVLQGAAPRQPAARRVRRDDDIR